MQSDTQSSSLALGQSLTPSSIVSHPNNQARKFFITLNPLSRTSTSQLSVVHLNKQEEKLVHNPILFDNYLKDICFLNEKQALVHSLNTSGKSEISTLEDESIEKGKGDFVKIDYDFGEQLRSIMPSKDRLYIQGEQSLFQFDLQKREKSQILRFDSTVDFAAVDIIHDNLVVCASNIQRKIVVIDTQTKTEKYTIGNINNSDVLSIHFNPIKQYNFISVFEDCFKVWDMRKTQLPVKCWDNHHSLILNAKYNSTYDELILTSYDDGTLGLFRMDSSTSMINKVNPSLNKEQEGLVKLYDEHEDSAYCISWASFTPWIFGSVSYNGNLIINEIPSALKVRILY